MCRVLTAIVTLLLAFAGLGRSTDPPAEKSITSKTATVDVELTEDIRTVLARAVAGESDRPARLVVRGLRSPEGWNGRNAVRVFVNKADATAETPVESSNYVWEFGLDRTDPDKPKNVGMDLLGPLKAIKWQPGDKIQLTFVLVSGDGAALPAETKVPFRDVVLSTTPPK